MSLADQIIEGGPWTGGPDARTSVLGVEITADDLNELRDELIAARKLREVIGRYEVSAFALTGVPADVHLGHDCPPWAVHIDQPITLAELVQRAEEHAEVCGG